MQSNDSASGASAARHKVANALAELGVYVRRDGGPPLDDDFKVAVISWKHGLTPRSGTIRIAFKWSQVTYEFDVPFTVFLGIAEGRVERYPLFSVTHDRGVPHDFVLGLNDDGLVRVIKDPGDHQQEPEMHICSKDS